MSYVPDNSTWGQWGHCYGAQDAPYRREPIKVEPKIRCGGCGRLCTKERGLNVTRTAVVCDRCLASGKHGTVTTVTRTVEAREFRPGETVVFGSRDGYKPREVTGVVAKRLRGNRYEVRLPYGKPVVLGASELTSKYGD